MTGYDAAEQYIEKIAFWKNVGSVLMNNLRAFKPSSILKGFNTSVGFGNTYTTAAKDALKNTIFNGVHPKELHRIKQLGYGAGILGAGTVGLGVGNRIAASTRANTPPPPTDVQVVYANPNRGVYNGY